MNCTRESGCVNGYVASCLCCSECYTATKQKCRSSMLVRHLNMLQQTPAMWSLKHHAFKSSLAHRPSCALAYCVTLLHNVHNQLIWWISLHLWNMMRLISLTILLRLYIRIHDLSPSSTPIIKTINMYCENSVREEFGPETTHTEFLWSIQHACDTTPSMTHRSLWNHICRQHVNHE